MKPRIHRIKGSPTSSQPCDFCSDSKIVVVINLSALGLSDLYLCQACTVAMSGDLKEILINNLLGVEE